MTAVLRLAPATRVERAALAFAAWLQRRVERRRERRALPTPRDLPFTAQERTEVRAHLLGIRR